MRSIVLVSLAAPILVAVACGGSNARPAGGAGSSSSSPDAKPPADAGPTTTTVMIPDGGDLTGVKLTSSSTTTIQNDAGGPSATATSPDHDPGRSAQDIQTIILSRRDQARACYDAALKNHPGIEGKIDIKWTIDPKGNVTQAAVDDAASDPRYAPDHSVGACIITLIKGIKFAESKPDAKWPQGRESHMHYPYDFHPKGKQVTPVPGN